MTISKWFDNALYGLGSGSPVTECFCGRTVFCDSEHYDEGEKEQLLALQQQKPLTYVYHEGDDYVSSVELLGQIFVRGCPCESLERIEAFLWEYHENIIQYLDSRMRASVKDLDGQKRKFEHLLKVLDGECHAPYMKWRSPGVAQ